MKTPKAIEKACQVLRRRVRFSDANLTLPSSPHHKDDNPAIRAASQLYVESWIIPLINCIERGDLVMLGELTCGEKGETIPEVKGE